MDDGCDWAQADIDTNLCLENIKKDLEQDSLKY